MEHFGGRTCLVPHTTIRRIRKTADRRIVQAHGTTDLRETIAVVEMRSTNGFIPPYSVGSKDEIGRSTRASRCR